MGRRFANVRVARRTATLLAMSLLTHAPLRRRPHRDRRLQRLRPHGADERQEERRSATWQGGFASTPPDPAEASARGPGPRAHRLRRFHAHRHPDDDAPGLPLGRGPDRRETAEALGHKEGSKPSSRCMSPFTTRTASCSGQAGSQERHRPARGKPPAVRGGSRALGPFRRSTRHDDQDLRSIDVSIPFGFNTIWRNPDELVPLLNGVVLEGARQKAQYAPSGQAWRKYPDPHQLLAEAALPPRPGIPWAYTLDRRSRSIRSTSSRSTRREPSPPMIAPDTKRKKKMPSTTDENVPAGRHRHLQLAVRPAAAVRAEAEAAPSASDMLALCWKRFRARSAGRRRRGHPFCCSRAGGPLRRDRNSRRRIRFSRTCFTSSRRPPPCTGDPFSTPTNWAATCSSRIVLGLRVSLAIGFISALISISITARWSASSPVTGAAGSIPS